MSGFRTVTLHTSLHYDFVITVQNTPNPICFVITDDENITNLIQKLQHDMNEADLSVGKNDELRNKILACLLSKTGLL